MPGVGGPPGGGAGTPGPGEGPGAPEPEEVLRSSLGGEDGGRIGIFPSWRWLYVSVVVYTLGLILLLYLFTVTFDIGAP